MMKSYHCSNTLCNVNGLKDICKVPKEIQLYWTFWEELMIDYGILRKGTCIIVPHSLHQEMIQLLNTGHISLEKMPRQSQTVNVLAWTVWRIKRPGNKLYYMFEVKLKKAKLSIQQTTCRTQNTHPPMIKTSLRYIPLLRWQLPTHHRLHIQISNHRETKLNDRQSQCPSHASNLCWIWMAQYIGNR